MLLGSAFTLCLMSRDRIVALLTVGPTGRHVRNYVRLVTVIRGRANHVLYQERRLSPAAQ